MGSILTNIIFIALPLIIAVVLHELAHGVAAEKLGDRTARSLGRITLNPIKHVDPVMTVLIPLLLIISGSPIIFGGAKPVPVNPFNLRNPRKDMALVALAGPVTNFVLAAISYFLFIFFVNVKIPGISFLVQMLLIFLLFSININLVLALFNLLPVPPLDGGRIVNGLLPERLSVEYSKLEPYGFFIVVALLYMGIFDKVLGPVIQFTLGHLRGLLG